MEVRDYHYNPATLVYLGSSEADPDPLEDGVWLLPANATRVAPPITSDNEVAQYDPQTDSWSVVLASVIQAAAEQATATSLQAQCATLARKIDSDADALIFQVVGYRTQEYLQSEAEAKAFQALDYEGVVPLSVKAWMDAVNLTAAQATDDIVARADQWRAAQVQLRAQRLALKHRALRAGNVADLSSVDQEWSTFIQSLSNQLGV